MQFERRKHKRIPRKRITDRVILATCSGVSKLQCSNDEIIDISIGGLRFSSLKNYEIGEIYEVITRIGAIFKLKERIVIKNINDTFYGAEFINLSSSAKNFIEQLYGSLYIKTNDVR